jgi:molybdate transport system permease protein
MIGGNIPGVTRTVSISIYDEEQSLNYAAANQTSLALLLFAFTVLAITYGLQRRFIHVWPTR